MPETPTMILDLPVGAMPVLTDVWVERARQKDMWGEQDHDPPVWLAILTEEVGELATAMLKHAVSASQQRHGDDMRREAIQVAAVAVAFVEYLDRRHEWEGRP